MVQPSSSVDEAHDGTRSRPSSSDEQEGNRRPVEAFRYAIEHTGLTRRERRGASVDMIEDAAIGRERAQAEEPAAGHLVVAGGGGVIAMVLRVTGGSPAMIHHVRVG